jgi:hypothetical protein
MSANGRTQEMPPQVINTAKFAVVTMPGHPLLASACARRARYQFGFRVITLTPPMVAAAGSVVREAQALGRAGLEAVLERP